MQDKQLVFITGGTGKTGRRVAERLTKAGYPVRAGSRSAERPFDWNQPETWAAAIAGAQAAYVTYYPDLAFPGAAETVRAFAKVAVESGVRRLVLLSGRGEPGALQGEQAVQESGAEWTVVRSSWFCQNFSEDYLLEPVLSGEVAFPAGDVPEPFIDADDIAEVAAAALTENRHVYQVYEVAGPRLLTFAEAIAEIAAVTRRNIRYVAVTPQQYASAMLEQGLPAEFVHPLVEVFATVLDGRNAHLTDGVERALGRPPRDFREFARRAAESGAWSDSRAAAGR